MNGNVFRLPLSICRPTPYPIRSFHFDCYFTIAFQAECIFVNELRLEMPDCNFTRTHYRLCCRRISVGTKYSSHLTNVAEATDETIGHKIEIMNENQTDFLQYLTARGDSVFLSTDN